MRKETKKNRRDVNGALGSCFEEARSAASGSGGESRDRAEPTAASSLTPPPSDAAARTKDTSPSSAASPTSERPVELF